MADEVSVPESALRKLPLPYSLALRLREAGVAPEVISEYIGIDEAALDGLYRIAEAKLMSAQRHIESTSGECDHGSDQA